jgi:hypothetical protein
MALNKLNHNYIEPLEVSSLVVGNLSPNSLTFAGSYSMTHSDFEITSTASTIIDTFIAANFLTVEYLLQIEQNNRVTSSKILLVTNGTVVNHTQFGILTAGEEISSTITSTIVGGNVRLSISIPKADIWNASLKIFKTSVTR